MVYCRAPEQLPRLISFTASDDSGATSREAFAIINFESVDNPPMIDLNGRSTPGVNFSTVFLEGSDMIPVRYYCICTIKYLTYTLLDRLLVLKHLSLMWIQKNSIS